MPSRHRLMLAAFFALGLPLLLATPGCKKKKPKPYKIPVCATSPRTSEYNPPKDAPGLSFEPAIATSAFKGPPPRAHYTIKNAGKITYRLKLLDVTYVDSQGGTEVMKVREVILRRWRSAANHPPQNVRLCTLKPTDEIEMPPGGKTRFSPQFSSSINPHLQTYRLKARLQVVTRSGEGRILSGTSQLNRYKPRQNR